MSTTDWVAWTAVYFLTVPEAASPRSMWQHIWYLLMLLSFFFLVAVFPCVFTWPFYCVHISLKSLPFLIRTLFLFLREGNGTPLQYSCLENPWTEEPGRLQSMESLRVRHDWATSLSLFSFMPWRRKWQPTPVFLPGESQGRWSLVGCRLWGHTELDTTEVT